MNNIKDNAVANCVGTFVRMSESGKHVCVILRANGFDTKGTVGYVRANPTIANLSKGDEFQAPAGWSTEHKEDEKGVTMSTKPTEEHPEGVPLTFFVW